MLNNIKAVIFDLDGTLIDSMFLWKQIDIDFLANRGIVMPPDLQKNVEGLSMRETGVYFQKTFQLTESVEELMRIWNDMAFDYYRHQVQPKPGAMEFLTYLKEHGYQVGIGTSNSPELLQAALQAQNMDRYIDTCVTSNEVAQGKPAPDVYLQVAKKLLVSPEHCLVFEDIVPGILAGRNAGMKVCGIYDDYSKDVTQEKQQLSDYYIEDYWQLLNRL